MPKTPVQSTTHHATNEGLQVLSYLIAGVGFYGALGWVGDHVLNTSFLLPIGIVVGAALGIFLIIRRFGGVGSDPTPDSTTGDSVTKQVTPSAHAGGEEERWDR